MKSSTQVHKDRWLNVRADECVTEEGHVIAPYYVLSYPDWVHVIALDESNQILMIEQYRHGLGVMSLEVPGGGLDEGETPIEAAKRELLEETGFEAETWSYCGMLAPNPAIQTNRSHIVLATNATQKRAPSDDPSERVLLKRFSVADVTRTALDGGVCQALHTSALLIALEYGGFITVSARPQST
ncbi:NUDIX hydrolase [Rhizobium cauense]|uniref:NUDIX hydrolase n=1 Tax=Rhizobium cauense TaxID=1166683 RepID=UPI0030B87D53